jgi:hypothetical protein
MEKLARKKNIIRNKPRPCYEMGTTLQRSETFDKLFEKFSLSVSTFPSVLLITISLFIPSSMDLSLYSERYKKDWDNISDFPNVGSVMSTSNIETDSFTDKCDPDLENAINDHVNLPKYYCPYPPKVPRNKHENNDLRRISAVGTETQLSLLKCC